jgi:hypothetical protein
MEDEPIWITRYSWLVIQAMQRGADPLLAIEAVSSTAIEHPEWNLDETRTLEEWSRGDA